MPTYEYACKACDHNFEIVQSFSEDTLTTCPECEQEALRKVYNAAGIIFKGDGWHVKDYASSAPSSTTSPGSGSTGTDDGSSSSDSASSSDSGSKSTSADSKKGGKKGGASGSGSAAAKPAAS